MSVTVTPHSILTGPLFRVEGDLVENYNRALEKTIGARTALTAFQIDKRGESPELEAELGPNYLQSGPAHRYCIILSPDQKHAGLIHEEFSFDHEVLDFLYSHYLSVISLATRVDSLYGELDDDVREYETLEDLLLIQKVHLELHTPSGFLTKARALQQHVRELEANPDLLIERESAFLRTMLDLISDVGDVRSYDLSPIQATKEVTTFFTRLFGGVCIFRNVAPGPPLDVKRPDAGSYLSQRLSDTRIAIENLPENLLDAAWETPAECAVPPMPRTLVMYRQTDYQPDDGPAVSFIPFHAKDRIIQFLSEHGYAAFSDDLLEPRLTRLEDAALLRHGYDVVTLGREQRIQALQQCRDSMLPEWSELKELKRNVTKGYEFSASVRTLSPEAQSLLLKSLPTTADAAGVVGHVLTWLSDYDYEAMYTYNTRHLNRLYERADDPTRNYIAHVLSNDRH